MAKSPAKVKFDGANEPPKVIVKKVYIEGGGGHHGGAWKVAYADFVTAMMAFFLLMWLLGATTEKQRKALADYFAPTLIELRQNSAGSNGLFGGESIVDRDNYPHKAAQLGTKAMTVPAGARGGDNAGTGTKGSLRSESRLAEEDKGNFAAIKRQLEKRMQSDKRLSGISKQVRFTRTKDGLQIDLVDGPDFSMFELGTTMLVPRASELVGEIGRSIAELDNPVTVRGHTDSIPYGDPKLMNNWMLSTGRAEATRRRLGASGVTEARYERIEGVADRIPLIEDNPADPRNRRVSITLQYRR